MDENLVCTWKLGGRRPIKVSYCPIAVREPNFSICLVWNPDNIIRASTDVINIWAYMCPRAINMVSFPEIRCQWYIDIFIVSYYYIFCLRCLRVLLPLFLSNVWLIIENSANFVISYCPISQVILISAANSNFSEPCLHSWRCLLNSVASKVIIRIVIKIFKVKVSETFSSFRIAVKLYCAP